MEAYGGPAQPSPTIAQCLNGGYAIRRTPTNDDTSLPLPRIDGASRVHFGNRISFRMHGCDDSAV
jgi:hypothetical protein